MLSLGGEGLTFGILSGLGVEPWIETSRVGCGDWFVVVSFN